MKILNLKALALAALLQSCALLDFARKKSRLSVVTFTKMTQNYIVTAHKPTAVNAAVTGRLKALLCMNYPFVSVYRPIKLFKDNTKSYCNGYILYWHEF